MGVEMNLRIKTKYRAADPEIRFLTKSILKPYGYATAIPPAWKLRFLHWIVQVCTYLELIVVELNILQGRIKIIISANKSDKSARLDRLYTVVFKW